MNPVRNDPLLISVAAPYLSSKGDIGLIYFLQAPWYMANDHKFNALFLFFSKSCLFPSMALVLTLLLARLLLNCTALQEYLSGFSFSSMESVTI
jgi:hypothetical protein